MEWTLGPRRSSCLWFQLFSVEMCSFLPDRESDGRHLSRQRETSHRRLHPLAEQALVEIAERSLPAAGHGRRTLEDGLHIMIVVRIEPTKLLWFLGTLQLSTHVPVLRTVARVDRQSAVRPQLPLAAEAMRGLDQGHQQRGPDRTDVRNLAQQFRGTMFSAFGQQIPSHSLAQRSHPIELLVEELGPPAHPGFFDLVQPLGTMTRCVDLQTPTKNAPASI